MVGGDWIKVRKSVTTDPRVVRCASALKADRLRTIGGILSAWCLFDTHTDDGRLDGYTADELDAMVGLPGLAHAMESVGWLIIEPQALVVPEFEKHMGKSAKRRARDMDRKSSARHADKLRTESGLETETETDIKKRKKRKSAAPPFDLLTLKLPFDSIRFESALKAWVAVRMAKKNPLTETAARLQMREFADWGEERSIRALIHTAKNNWIGIREPEADDSLGTLDIRTEQPKPRRVPS